MERRVKSEVKSWMNKEKKVIQTAQESDGERETG